MSEDMKNKETEQPVSDEELDTVSGGFGSLGGMVTRLPYKPGKKPQAIVLPDSGEKPKVTLL